MKLLKSVTNLQKIGFNGYKALLAVCSKNTRYIKRNSGSINGGVGSFSDMDFLKPEPKPKLVVFDLGNVCGSCRVTLVIAFDFLLENFGSWWGLQMVLCHSMNAG